MSAVALFFSILALLIAICAAIRAGAAQDNAAWVYRRSCTLIDEVRAIPSESEIRDRCRSDTWDIVEKAFDQYIDNVSPILADISNRQGEHEAVLSQLRQRCHSPYEGVFECTPQLGPIGPNSSSN